MPALAATPDPHSAWQPWEPTAIAPWNRRLAAHLLRRTSFGASAAQLDEAVATGPQECVERLLSACGKNDAARHAFDVEMASLAAGLTASGPQALEPWWLYRLLFTPAPLAERMTLFWHGHFATSAATVQNAAMMLRQNETLRLHALGDFESLVQAVSRDPAMLTYLNSTTNARLHPNENYARELMELLAIQLRSNGFRIEPVVRQILTSRYFYSPSSVGQKIRRPCPSSSTNGVVFQPASPRSGPPTFCRCRLPLHGPGEKTSWHCSTHSGRTLDADLLCHVGWL